MGTTLNNIESLFDSGGLKHKCLSAYKQSNSYSCTFKRFVSRETNVTRVYKVLCVSGLFED